MNLALKGLNWPCYRKRLGYAARYLVLTSVSAVFIGPLLWMLSSSFKGPGGVLRYPPEWIPVSIHWSNYRRVFSYQPFGSQIVNSLVVMAAVCAITVVVSTLAGYGFARVRMRGAQVLFVLCLCGAFLPPESTIVPLFRLASSLGWVDTLWPLIVFTPFLATAPLGTFVMRQAFLSLPREFAEAGRVDGAGRWRILFQIYLPMVRPSVAAVVVFTAWYSWNQFIEPLVYIRSAKELTVPVGLTHYVDPFAGPLWGVQMAATTISIVPVLIVFLAAQRHVVAGLTAGGVK